MTVPPGYHDLPRYLQSLSLCTLIWFPEGKWALPTWYYCINFSWGDETKCVHPRYGIKHKSSLSSNLENWCVYSPGDRLVPGSGVIPWNSCITTKIHSITASWSQPFPSYALQHLPRSLARMGGWERIMLLSQLIVLRAFSSLSTRVCL